MENPIGGVGVTGLGLELSGRFGPQLDDLLRRLAGYKRAIQTAAGRDAGRPLQAWRLAFSLALARFTAASIRAATDALPVGTSNARCLPADDRSSPAANCQTLRTQPQALASVAPAAAPPPPPPIVSASDVAPLGLAGAPA